MADIKSGDMPETTGSLFGELETASATTSDTASSESKLAAPSPSKKPQRTKGDPNPRKAAASAEAATARPPYHQPGPTAAGELISVRAGQLVLHPALEVTRDELEGISAEQIDEIADSFRRGVAPAEFPRVVALPDGQYGALTGLETVIAAQRVGLRLPALVVTVIVTEPLEGADRLMAALNDTRRRSPWEQYREVAGVFGDGQVRAKLREFDLPVERFESRVSKLLKLGRLDPLILSAVNKLTIQVKEAGQVVDGWADLEKRLVMEQVLREKIRNTNGFVDACALFRAMLAAGRPEVALPVWRSNEAGENVFTAADGSVLAKLTLTAEGWQLEGKPLSALHYRAMAKGLPLAKG